MIQPLDNSDAITIPLARVNDLPRVGAVAAKFASLLGRSIEVVSIIDPEDDFAPEFRRYSEGVERLARAIAMPVQLRLVAHQSPLQGVLEACVGRLVCMATAASPFDNRHYVGSFAAALLSESTAPVILVGPAVTDEPVAVDKIVVAVSNEVDGHASLRTANTLARTLDVPLAKIVIDPKGVVYETDYSEPDVGLPDEVHAAMTRGPLSHEQICDELVERSESAILVLATRAHRGLSWICEGSVAFDTIGRTTGPVVAVGPRAFGEEHLGRQLGRGHEVVLQSPDASGAALELDERLRFLGSASAATYTARPS
ncbi:MAG: hypothetical protein R8J94_13090 [Acidimicrobiia bacterium]|nr:hypothetical protein [Acidimicrobiia bacterium]